MHSVNFHYGEFPDLYAHRTYTRTALIDLCADKRPGFPYPRTELSRAQIPYSRTEPLNHGQYVK